jgi:thymidylate kinase
MMHKANQQEPMRRPEIDFDVELNRLEFEWRQGYEASIAARAAYQALAANRKAKVELVDAARERLDRAEAVKSRIMAKIERLEDHMLSRG